MLKPSATRTSFDSRSSLPTGASFATLGMAVEKLSPAQTPREAALMVAAILWARAAAQLHKESGYFPVEWGLAAANRLGVATTRKELLLANKMLILPDEHLPLRLGHYFDWLHHKLHRPDKSGQLHEQKRRGSFLTPYPVAKIMVARAFGNRDTSDICPLLDPGTGTGVFLSAALNALQNRGLSSEQAAKCLYGVELTRPLGELAHLLVSLEAGFSPDEILAGGGITVWLEDFLLPSFISNVDSFGFYSTIIMNPPYERVGKIDFANPVDKKMAASYSKTIKRSGLYPLSTNGALDTYRLFLERGLSLLSKNGRMSAIIPSSFLADAAATKLREALVVNNRIESVDLYPENANIFKGVTQEVVILTASAAKSAEGITLLSQGRRFGFVDFDYLRNVMPAFEIPLLPKEHLSVYEHLARFPRLKDLEGVQVLRGELDQSFYKDYFGIGHTRFLRGKHVHKFSADHGECCDIEKLVAEKSLGRKLTHIYAPRLAGRQVTNQRASQRLVFAYIDPPAALGNSLNYILVDSTTAAPGVSLWTLLGVLNSAILDWFFRVTNSNNHVGIYELKNLPFPADAPKDLLKNIEQVSRKISLEAAQNKKLRQLTAELNTLVLKAFGLSGLVNIDFFMKPSVRG